MLISEEYNHSSSLVNNCSSLTVYNHGYTVKRMKYGERLKQARKYRDITQSQLSALIDNVCTQENISKLERGDATGSEYTVQFAQACGVRPMWLAEEQGEMVDGVYVEDEQLKHLVMVCEKLPRYAVGQIIRYGDEIAELIKQVQATDNADGTNH